LPTDPRPTNKIPAGLRPGTSSGVDARSPSPSAGHTRGANSLQYSVPAPDSLTSLGSYNQPWNSSPAGRNYSTNGSQSPGSTLQKKSSYRPPGASAPRIPGHADDYSGMSPSAETYTPMSSASNTYFPFDTSYTSNLSDLSKIPPPPPLNPPAQAQTPPRPKNPSDRDSDDILAPGAHGFARPLSHSELSHPLSRYLSDRPDRRPPPAASSENPLRSTSTVSTSSSTHLSGLERNLTASTIATMSTQLTTCSSPSSRDKDLGEHAYVERGDSYNSSKLRDYTPGPVPVSDRQPSEPARSEVTARSRLASEIERLKSREAMEDATNSYADDDYYDDDDEYYSEEESLDSFVNFSLLSNIAVWLRDQVPRGTHVKGSIPYARAFTGKDIVVRELSSLSSTNLTLLAMRLS
jgi:hypothetical protein